MSPVTWDTLHLAEGCSVLTVWSHPHNALLSDTARHISRHYWGKAPWQVPKGGMCVSHVNCPIMSCWLDSVNQRGPFVHAGLLTCDTDTCRSCQSSTAPEVLMKRHLLTWLDLPGAWIDASALPLVDSKLARQFNCFCIKMICEIVCLFTLNLIGVSSSSRWTWRFVRFRFRAEPCTTAVWRATSKRWRNLRKILWVLKTSLKKQNKASCYLRERCQWPCSSSCKHANIHTWHEA